MDSKGQAVEDELKVDRRRGERRKNEDSLTDVDRRQQDRRKQIDPTTCERDYAEDEVEFMNAMDLYKRKSGRQFPTWSEVLEVLHSLGYRKVAEPTEIDHTKRHDP